MSRKRSLAGLVASALIALPLALSAGMAKADATKYPLTLKNCGVTLTFKQAPSHIVSIGQSSTEILYSLGLAEKVAGTALWVGPVLPQFAAANAKVKRLADNDPSFESVVGQHPDLVTNQFQWQVGPNGVVGTRKQFADLGIPVYTSPSDCVGKNNAAGGDGTRSEPFTTALIDREIADLAEIFNVQDRGQALIAKLKAREAAAKAMIAGVKKPVSAVFWFSSPAGAGDPYVAGQLGAPGYIMSTLGVKNVITTNDEWPTVGWETIARANPTFIVLAKMSRRRFPADDVAVKERFLHDDPVASQMSAVKQGHIIEIDAQAMNPTIRTIDGIEILAKALKDAGYAK
ncbi:ABC transporter substrate-binding protein [Jiella sp. MQZ9-1]|uniref:ABC transporter substrate-binding protein n=1 Tax=Jiella flava TaxID=2816857 RepID=A0A939FYE2_9HYPH|nr:ABC transporter substrate-binding protein [Jiella flava]MBO0662470.1 ABC transporter substrate-binding protein [Jiella flava]MCD2471695.1 ABC transporter substrate-binding protein [Jiella flava]